MKNEIDLSAEIQQLADVLIKSSPECWDTMCIAFEFYDKKDYGIDSWSEFLQQKKPIDFLEEDIDQLETIFKSIRKKTSEAWKRVCFRITNEGDFDISFDY